MSSGLRSRIRSASQSPASSRFDSGGRSYGWCGSSPITVIAPSYPAGPQRLDRAQPRQRGTHDHHPVHHTSIRSTSATAPEPSSECPMTMRCRSERAGKLCRMSERPRFHLAFPVDDLAAARRFYGEVLGCPEGRSADHWVDFDLYGHQIVAHLVAPAVGASDEPGRRRRRAGAALRAAAAPRPTGAPSPTAWSRPVSSS